MLCVQAIMLPLTSTTHCGIPTWPLPSKDYHKWTSVLARNGIGSPAASISQAASKIYKLASIYFYVFCLWIHCSIDGILDLCSQSSEVNCLSNIHNQPASYPVTWMIRMKRNLQDMWVACCHNVWCLNGYMTSNTILGIDLNKPLVALISGQ